MEYASLTPTYRLIPFRPVPSLLFDRQVAQLGSLEVSVYALDAGSILVSTQKGWEGKEVCTISCHRSTYVTVLTQSEPELEEAFFVGSLWSRSLRRWSGSRGVRGRLDRTSMRDQASEVAALVVD